MEKDSMRLRVGAGKSRKDLFEVDALWTGTWSWVGRVMGVGFEASRERRVEESHGRVIQRGSCRAAERGT